MCWCHPYCGCAVVGSIRRVIHNLQLSTICALLARYRTVNVSSQTLSTCIESELLRKYYGTILYLREV